MPDFFPADVRRNPFAFYDQFRAASPVLHAGRPDLWMLFDYDDVKRGLEDHATFSSAAAPPDSTGKPFDWLVFNDPPRHTKLRALVARAFTPRIVADLEPRVRQISRELLDACLSRGELDFVAEYSSQLPVMVIAELLGIPFADRPRLNRWNDLILGLANTVAGGEAGALAAQAYGVAKAEMTDYLAALLRDRRRAAGGDLLTALAQAEVNGQQLDDEEILGFFQLLLAAGSETTINLINNAVVCLLEHPDQLSRLREHGELLPSAIEEVLRYRSPFQAVFRQTTRDVSIRGQVIPEGKLVLPLIGSANRDPRHFPDADRFDISRQPNSHLAFGHGIHFCIGAPLSRLEARIALSDLLARTRRIEFADKEPWEPRPAFHVHGPARLAIRLEAV